MVIKVTEISRIIEKKIDGSQLALDSYSKGEVIELKDGVVQIYGLNQAMYGEMIEFENSQVALVLNLDKDVVGAITLGDYKLLKEGDVAKCTGRQLEVPVGKALLGRVVDARGEPIDGNGDIKNVEKGLVKLDVVEKVAPGVIERKSVLQPLQTGLMSVDTMVPIGRGQRELIIGDRQTGKTAIAIDTIINQKDTGVVCVYVAIGQKSSSVAATVNKLSEHGALAHTIIVAANAADPAAMQYLAPFSGTTMGEYFRDRGQDALIVYDDLSKQAVAYRQISLLLKRPPGREAYPGDIFYLHSRLLERSSRVTPEYIEKTTGVKTKKTGSLTALPIIETQAGDVSAFVPTNVISITDGQIYLDSDLFNSGIRPAINSGLSVSRVGGAAQTKLIKRLGGKIRLALAQFRELEAFSQFASDLDDATRNQLERGKRVTECLKQKQFSPMSIADMAVCLFAVQEGLMDSIALERVMGFQADLIQHMYSKHNDTMQSLIDEADLSDDLAAQLKSIITQYKQDHRL
ncbi:MAG: F0F1 ATP synthase subunit alpha [Legionellales bacterium]|nr:F0F1 ATP synthase subunit alpha [Legionellales bacterium]|tara:strand:- start:648 stop:2201 length:1554 start_codon:yes stop_codon:yes gene_type:complete